MQFYFVYALHNVQKNFIYIGFTHNPMRRLKQHNNKEVTSTKRFVPLKLIHLEGYVNKSDALRREKYLKTNKGRTTLVTMLKEYFKNKQA